MNGTRPWYWSVRREVWEHRSIWMAPLIVGAFVLFAASFSTLALPGKVRNFPNMTAAQQRQALDIPFSIAPAVIMMTTFLVGLFYAVDALYGERRDRSILFWKSLPVSDRTAVLAKASIPLLVLPAIAFVLSVIAYSVLLLLGTLVLAGSGVGAGPLWSGLRFVQMPLVMFYGLAVHSLWFAPVYGWLLLISVWARRAPFLWAVLPPFAIAAFESVAFRSKHFVSFLRYRSVGAMEEAFVLPAAKHAPIDRLSQLNLFGFLSTPGLWLGLIFAAACLAVAVRLRQKREPV